MVSVQRPDFSLFYEKTNITADIEPHLIELNYTDYLEGQSDELTVRFEDISGKWIRQWFPTQGDKLKAAIGYASGQLVDIGAFEIDEVEYEYKPSVITLRALSTGVTKASRTLQPKAYEKTTLAQIVAVVAKRLQLKVVGKIKHIPIQRVTQYQERDVEFLSRLAREYHHSFKIVDEQLVFSDKSDLGMAAPVAVLDESQCKTIRLRDRIKDAAKQVDVSGFDVNGKQVVKKTKKKQGLRKNIKQAQTSNEDTLKIVTRGESHEQIDACAQAALETQDEERCAGEITIIGNPKLVAGATIMLRNLGIFSGKYLIKSSRHSIAREQGYITNIEVRMIEFIADDLQTIAMETAGNESTNA